MLTRNEMLEAFEGNYNVTSAVGDAFGLLSHLTQIVILRNRDGERGTVKIRLFRSNASPQERLTYDGRLDERGNLIVRVPHQKGQDDYHVVIAGWTDDSPVADGEAPKKLLFGQTYVGDPQGAGGFGAEEEEGGDYPDRG